MAVDAALDPRVAARLSGALGQRAWGARPGHGSMLSLELGEPALVARSAPAEARAPGRAAAHAVHGRWHLWVTGCAWVLRDGEGRARARSAADRATSAPGLVRLDGRALSAVEVDPASGAARFAFGDLSLETRTDPGLPPGEAGGVEHWLLFLPDGDVLTVRGDAAFSLAPGDSRAEPAWRPLRAAPPRLVWPRGGPRAGEGPPEAFVLLEGPGGRALSIGSNLEHEVWLDGAFAGDGGHRCVDGEAALEAWDATGARRVLVRLRWVDPTRSVLYCRRAFADPFVALEAGEDLAAWTCALDVGLSVTPTKVSDQLARQNVLRAAAPAPGERLELAPAAPSRPWSLVDLGVRRPRLVAVAPRLVERDVGRDPGQDPGRGAAPPRAAFDPTLGADLASAPARWAKEGLPPGVARATYDLGAIALHRVETTCASPLAVCWSEVPAFADAWATTNRVQVRMVDAVAGGLARAAPFGWRGGRYAHVLHRAGDEPVVAALRREYPLEWRDLPPPEDARDRAILAACRANLVACVDGGLVDTCWRERGQWTGDLRASALALRALATNDEPVALALRQIAASYGEGAAMVQAVWPATLPQEPLFIPGYHLAWCLTALEHGLARLPRDVSSLARRSLEAWRVRYLKPDGLLDGFPAASWWFVDWDPERGAPPPPRRAVADAVTHAWFHEACVALGLPGLEVAAVDAAFWTGRAYAVDLGGPDSPQATAAAVSAFPTSPHREAALDWLVAQHEAGRLVERVTPYFGYFVAKAVRVRSRALMLDVIRGLYHERCARWGTVPEKTGDRASLAHGWSVGVAALLV